MKNKSDRIENLSCGSLIQHGRYNDRIYLMREGPEASPRLPKELIFLARKKGYGKIFAKVPSDRCRNFLEAGFEEEARVPGLYYGQREGIFLAYFLSGKRKIETDVEIYEKNKHLAFKKKNSEIPALDKERFSLRRCDRKDADEMAQLYRAVFPSYPFAIGSPSYIAESMKKDVDYFCVEKDGKIVALSSAEMDCISLSAEMTDFATLPEWRGNSLGINLLKNMECSSSDRKMRTLYTISRSASPGMNIIFARSNYSFAGRLKNNTNISGRIESMNIWYKRLN